MNIRLSLLTAAVAISLVACGGNANLATTNADAGIRNIDTLVVIYAENRGFDTLYGLFPGADGIPGVNPSAKSSYIPQKDYDGSTLPGLPPTWGCVTLPGQTKVITQAQSANMPNRPFQIDSAAGLNADASLITRDLVHRF